ncbi:hypothetical protein EV199_1671 [Pseudobacter ginsenosidimutans]|uniref:Uncharacterized protein n=1 Tax=Pseudobacter ginsenosidimutans TaxID=661488 RepID=A0A4V2F225_9BACT|nr:hypothetical protein EV199_1671 [Pseudobacter ginsenosidimutans]
MEVAAIASSKAESSFIAFGNFAGLKTSRLLSELFDISKGKPIKIENCFIICEE